MFEMSLPIGQQRVLESIEGKLAESDPRLASLFSIFTRLNLAEKMPWIEQVAVRPVADRLASVGSWFRWTARRPAARHGAAACRTDRGRLCPDPRVRLPRQPAARAGCRQGTRRPGTRRQVPRPDDQGLAVPADDPNARLRPLLSRP